MLTKLVHTKREFPFVFRRSFWLNSISLISFMFMNPLHSVLSSIARGTCLCFILNGPFLCRILIIPYILTIIPKEFEALSAPSHPPSPFPPPLQENKWSWKHPYNQSTYSVEYHFIIWSVAKKRERDWKINLLSWWRHYKLIDSASWCKSSANQTAITW